MPKLSAKFKLKRTPAKAPITMIPSRPTFTIPPRSEKVPPILVKISGAEYFSIEATIKAKIVIKSILVLSSFSFHCFMTRTNPIFNNIVGTNEEDNQG